MNTQILKKAIETYGEEPQIRQCMEECAELIQAINKHKRAQGSLKEERYNIAFDNLLEEIADVEIMLEQIKHLLEIPEEDLLAMKTCKINRTKERMAQGR